MRVYSDCLPTLLQHHRRIDEQKVQLSQFVTGVKFKFGYEYDFGDCWGNEILVEKILKCEPQIIYPICLKGKRACENVTNKTSISD